MPASASHAGMNFTSTPTSDHGSHVTGIGVTTSSHGTLALTVPLHDRSAADAIAEIDRAGLAPASIGTRRPTLDDVYLRLTGGRLAEAA